VEKVYFSQKIGAKSGEDNIFLFREHTCLLAQKIGSKNVENLFLDNALFCQNLEK